MKKIYSLFAAVLFAGSMFAADINVTMTKGLIWDDEISSEGWWQMYGHDANFSVSLSNGNSITQAAGTYTVAQLEDEWSYIVAKSAKTDTIHFTAGSVIVAVNGSEVTIKGDLTGDNSNVYKFNLTYNNPQASTTVNLSVPNAVYDDTYVSKYYLHGCYGSLVDGTEVSLYIYALDLSGDFGQDDLYSSYSYVYINKEVESIYTAAIKVIPGNGDSYAITADLLCYNWTLYKVSMTIPGSGASIEEVEAAAKNAIKRMMNGQLVIEKDGKFFNANGARVK